MPIIFCVPLTYRLSFPHSFLFLSTPRLCLIFGTLPREKKPNRAALHEAKLVEQCHELGTLEEISLLIMQSSRSASCFVCLVQFWGKKIENTRMLLFPRGELMLRATSWERSTAVKKQALPACHNDISLGSVPSGLKGQWGRQRIFLHQTKYYIVLF